MKVRTIIMLVVATIILIFMAVTCGHERIDAGFDGIRVNRYGDEKGVDKITEVTGSVWYNKITFDIYEVPTHVLDYNYDTMGFKTKDMLDTKIGIGVQVGLPTGETPALFVHYRRYFTKGTVDLDQLIYKHVRQGTSDAVGQYDAEDLIIFKQIFREAVDSIITEKLTILGFEVEDVFLIGDPDIPLTLKKRVNDKIEADQIAQQKESEIRQAEADALKRVATAKGFAESQVIEAKADMEAYNLQARELTPLIIQKMYIEKWNGVLPENAIVPKVFSDITGK